MALFLSLFGAKNKEITRCQVCDGVGLTLKVEVEGRNDLVQIGSKCS